MKMKKMFGTLTAKFAAMAVAVGLAGSAWADPVARVGSTDYDNIADAITAWTGANNSTLTLLANVTLPNVVQVKSTEMHTLDLGTYTLTAASGKNAIQILNYGRTSASYALDIKADATNPGGISASGKACIYYIKNSGDNTSKDRPIIRIYGGIFSGAYCMQHSGSNGTNCPQFWIYGGIFNGTKYAIYTNRALIQIYGGTFNKKNMISPDSSAYTRIQGGKFVEVGNNFSSALTSGKWTYGTSMGSFNVDVTVDADGYYVVSSPIVEKPGSFEASVKQTLTDGTHPLYYSNVRAGDDSWLYYATAEKALPAVASAGGNARLYVSSSVGMTINGKTVNLDATADDVTYTGNVTFSGSSGTFTISFKKEVGYYGNVTATKSGYRVSLSETEADGVVTRTYTVQSNTAITEANAEAAVVSSNGSTNYYGSVYDAFYAVDGNTEGKTIVLLKDVNNASILTNGKAVDGVGKTVVTFDLNGHAFTLQSAGTGNDADYTLTVVDSSEEGTGEVMNTTLSLLKIALTGTGDYSGKYTLKVRGGTWHFDPSAVTYDGNTYDVVDDGYAAVQVGDVWKVGKIAQGNLTQEAGATETEATYTVPVTLTNDGGGILANLSAATVDVSIGAEDIAHTKLTSVNLNDVVSNAVVSVGADAPSVTKVAIEVVASVTSSGEGSVSYEVHPQAVVTVTKNATDTTSTVPLSNDDLAANASFTFDLDVTALGVAAGDWVKVTHVSAGYPNEEGLYKAKAGGSGVVVTVTTTHFSTFTATPGDPEGADASLLPSVTNSVVSANCFGALTVGGTAKPAYVAVPFGAFGDGDAQIAAADIVQAAALSDGDKMYVWNGTEGGQQKYEVYTVSGGAWTAAKKVTVAADGTQTEGSVSPDAFPVASGKGVFIERADTSKPLYVYGQVLTNATAETTFEAGLTLVSAPSTKAMGEIDLNSLTWSGVTTLPTKTARDKTYPDLSKINDADYIYFRNAAGSTIKCYYSNGKWVTENGSTVVKVPAGTAFWYSGKAAGAKVTW